MTSDLFIVIVSYMGSYVPFKNYNMKRTLSCGISNIQFCLLYNLNKRNFFIIYAFSSCFLYTESSVLKEHGEQPILTHRYNCVSWIHRYMVTTLYNLNITSLLDEKNS